MKHAKFLPFLVLPLLPLTAPAQNQEYPDFYTGKNGASPQAASFVESIAVLSPAYRSDIKGEVSVVFKAPGMQQAQAHCWQQPNATNSTPLGHDADVGGNLALDAEGNGKFVFHADQFPNGPITIRIQARGKGGKQDLCELQLFNQGGVVWNQGIPKETPPGARGMPLLFADDFNRPLSISPDGKGATYAAHKSGGGDFSGWPFANPEGDDKPFGQVGTFLRIRASKEPGTNGRAGILSSIRSDGTGVLSTLPCYFECRFVAQSAPGTWPAFWLLTKGQVGLTPGTPQFENAKKSSDEHDIIEAYGGYGPKNPNSGGLYAASTHLWGQPAPGWALKDNKPNARGEALSFRPDTLILGGKASWSWTFHTYGVAITPTTTTYYYDNIEIGHQPTGDLSKAQPHWFLINYAIGGISGWQINLDRYANGSDMYVDFVRVYGQKP